jgi:hypothetical protein
MRLPYEAMDDDEHHYRVENSGSRAKYHPDHGIRAHNVEGEVFPEEPMTILTQGHIPF